MTVFNGQTFWFVAQNIFIKLFQRVQVIPNCNWLCKFVNFDNQSFLKINLLNSSLTSNSSGLTVLRIGTTCRERAFEQRSLFPRPSTLCNHFLQSDANLPTHPGVMTSFNSSSSSSSDPINNLLHLIQTISFRRI